MRWLDVKHRVALRGQHENRPGFLFDRQRRTWQRLRCFANWFWGLSKVLCNYLHVQMVQTHPIKTMFFVYVYICMYASCIYIYIITDKLACAYIHTCRQTDRQTEYTYWFYPLYTYTLHACTGICICQLLICWICLSLAVAKVLERKKAWERTEWHWMMLNHVKWRRCNSQQSCTPPNSMEMSITLWHFHKTASNLHQIPIPESHFSSAPGGVWPIPNSPQEKVMPPTGLKDLVAQAIVYMGVPIWLNYGWSLMGYYTNIWLIIIISIEIVSHYIYICVCVVSIDIGDYNIYIYI
jgi:hypothetical protein